MFSLVIINSNNEQVTFPLNGAIGSRYSVGRSEDCDIALPQEVHLSRIHCHITIETNGALLADNNSSNGIFENEERVNSINMQPGKEYGMGACRIMLQVAKPLPLNRNSEKKAAHSVRKFTPPPPRKAPVKRPTPRPFYTAAGTLNTETRPATPRKLKPAQKDRRGHITRTPSIPATEYGLPHDFDLIVTLQNTETPLQSGDLLRFSVQADKDCFVYLIQYDSENNAAMLLPGVGGAENKLTASQPISVPPTAKDSSYEIYVEEPYGKDTILAIACTERCKFEKNWSICLDFTDALLRRPGEVEQAAIKRCNCPGALWSAAVLCITTG